MDQAPHWQDGANPVADGDAPSIADIRRDLRKIPPVRLVAVALLLILALVVARFSWQLPVSWTQVVEGDEARIVYHFPDRAGEERLPAPLTLDAERALYDWRAFKRAAASPVDVDPRISIVAYVQQTLQNTGKRSPLDRALLAKALTAIDAMGPKAIGIDILFDQKTPEDEELIADMRSMKTPLYLAYTTNSANPVDVEYWQQEFMDDWHRRVNSPRVHKASIAGRADDDNVMRRWPPVHPELPTFMPIALTGKTAYRHYQGSVLFREPVDVSRGVFNKLDIDTLANPDIMGSPEGAAFVREQIRDRIVLIGGDLADRDQFETPATPYRGATMSGLEILATETAQLLDRRMPGQISGWMLWVLAVLVVAAGMFTALLDVRPWAAIVIILGQLAFFATVPFFFERIGMDTYGLPAFGWLAGWIVAFTATGSAAQAAGSDQKKYAQSALGKYLPKDIAAQIIKDPEKLSLTGEKRKLFTLFSDIEGFTTLSHILPAERTAALLNGYLDGMSKVVLDHGGTIDKFVGDAVVAFWGAPIARPDDADRAIAALLAMNQFTKTFALPGSNDAAMMGRTRVGLHYGDAVVGNFGGEGRLTYTALGDAMNCAARLEGANKYLKTVALVSQEARDMSTSTLFRPMGRIEVPGRSTALVVWEPAPGMSEAERALLSQLWTRFDNGEREALDEIEQICLTHDKDVALAAFAVRLREVGPGGTYQLKEK